LNAFGEVLRLADEVCILPIFAAREENLWGVKEEELAQRANATYVKTAAQAKRFLQKRAQENDVILLLGAGDFCGLCELIQ
jgi:UDP-N-acetylmuramate-alanine ligase